MALHKGNEAQPQHPRMSPAGNWAVLVPLLELGAFSIGLRRIVPASHLQVFAPFYPRRIL